MTVREEGESTNVHDVRLETQRLVLDRLVAEDAEKLFAYRSNPDVFRYQNWRPSSLADAELFIESVASLDFDTPRTWFQLGIRLRRSSELVGDIGVYFCDGGHSVEIGFTLTPEHQGYGYATEAVAAVLDVVFGELGKHRVTASIDPLNAPSIALATRLGMRQEAHFHESSLVDGEWADDLVFALLQQEWAAKRDLGDRAS